MLSCKSLWINELENNATLGSSKQRHGNRLLELTDMPAEIQKAIDLTLTNCKSTYAYSDDIPIVTKGSLELHKNILQTVLQKLDEKHLALSIDKCKFACKQVEWLGCSIDSEGTTSIIRKTEATEKVTSPETFKKKVIGAQYTISQGTV